MSFGGLSVAARTRHQVLSEIISLLAFTVYAGILSGFVTWLEVKNDYPDDLTWLEDGSRPTDINHIVCLLTAIGFW